MLGAIPFSYLIARFLKGVDIRQHGSGNVGAANVARVSGLLCGILALLLDLTKGALAAFLATLWSVPVMFAGLAVIGHNWSIFLRFSGGKGVATSLGILAVLAPPAFLIALLIWAGTVALTRYVSVGSMTALMISPLFVSIFKNDLQASLLMLALGILTVIRHQGNIKRLMKGEEHKIFQKK